jgi:hypothetical protein
MPIRLNNIGFEVVLRLQVKDTITQKWLDRLLSRGFTLEDIFEESEEFKSIQDVMHFTDSVKIDNVEIIE